MASISIRTAVDVFRRLNGKCPYDFGTKWPLGSSVESRPGKKVDCSGFVRWIIHAASLGKVDITDGSYLQKEKVAALGWRKLNKYSDLSYTVKDEDRLFIGFLAPVYIGKRLVKAGHVWLVWKGVTIESRGATIGVSSRKWNTPVFLLRGAVAFEVPCVENK